MWWGYGAAPKAQASRLYVSITLSLFDTRFPLSLAPPSRVKLTCLCYEFFFFCRKKKDPEAVELQTL